MDRQFISSLERYHGEYLIVCDSAHEGDRREDKLSSRYPGDGDGIITIGYAKPTTWVKEEEPPAPAARSLVYIPPPEKVVVGMQDRCLGIHNRSSTTLKPAAYSVRRSSCKVPSPCRRWSSDSATLVDGRLGGSSYTSNAGSRFWRFDWQTKRVPAFGYGCEGMDLTMSEGHALSFMDAVDDHGFPFAILELRGIADVGCVVVVAKKQALKCAKRHLSLTEKMRLDMHIVQRQEMVGCVEDLHQSLKKVRNEYIPKKAFGALVGALVV